MRTASIPFALLCLGACTLPPTQPREARLVGQTDTGRTLHTFQITRANPYGLSPVPETAITTRARQICTKGYEGLERRGDAERRISGIIYTDVEVTILCR